MNEQLFINEAIDSAIRKYIKCKEGMNEAELDSFECVVIRALVLIYGELDILNPFKINNEKNFNDNLKKFGLSETTLLEFKERFFNFYKNAMDTLAVKQDFLSIQKSLIDMFMLKKSHVLISDDEIEQFKNLLYTREDANPSKFAFYSKYTPESDEIKNYYNNELFKLSHTYNFTQFNDLLLSNEAYQLAGYNFPEIQNKKESEIQNINNKVYHFFNIKDNDKNKKDRLESAILYYKKYGNTEKGNGYVNLLLVLSMVATGLMMVLIFGIQFLR